MPQTFSGYIGANDGFDGPAPFDGPTGWTVNKEQQSEIFKIHHGLNLSKPHKLRVVATTQKAFTIANIESLSTNDFEITVWTTNGTPAITDVSFVGVLS
ncbi:MAG: hypothetical protein JWM78_1553 [Verrucomicrobiaceae bacterium]|nr:hypothetical protein [Verrucomicrobiaceae bacterium]